MSRRHQAAVWPSSALFTVSGAVLLGFAAQTPPTGWLERVTVTVCGTGPSGSHAVLLGLVLLVLGGGLRRRRMVSWGLGFALVVWSALTEAQSLAVHSPGEPWRLVPLLLAVIALLRARDRFTVRPDPRRVRQAAATVIASSATILLLGGGGLFAERGRFAEPLSAGDVGRALVGAVAANPWPTDFAGPDWLLPGLSLAAGLTLIAVLSVLLAAAPAPEPAAPAERAAMRALVAHPDADSLAPFALRHDKTYQFGPDGGAAIGFRVLAGVAMAGGDPVGAQAAWPGAIDAFLARARRHGWRPAVLGAGAHAQELWAQRGMRAISIGDEVIVDVEAFSLAGKSMRNARQAVRRTENIGVTASIVRERELDPELAAQLRHIHLAWLAKGSLPRRREEGGGPYGRERGFAMNLDAMAEGRHPDALLAIAFAADGYVVSFQRYLPAAAAGPAPILSLDVMPRDRVAPNGVNERLIVAMIEYAGAHGYSAVSLNFAAFRPLFDSRRPPTRSSRAARRAVHLLDPLIQVESLYRFNMKFRPSWLPRAVLIRSWLDLPLFAIAVLGLEFALPYDRRRSRPQALGARRPAGQDSAATGAQGADQPNWSAVHRHSSRSGSSR
jgi:lysyl-tRNA synthetase class 2